MKTITLIVLAVLSAPAAASTAWYDNTSWPPPDLSVCKPTAFNETDWRCEQRVVDQWVQSHTTPTAQRYTLEDRIDDLEAEIDELQDTLIDMTDAMQR